METPNGSSQPEVSKLTSNQMIFCPWISRPPLITSTATKNGLKTPDVQANCSNMSKSYINCQHSIINQTCNVNQQMEANAKRPFPFSCSPIQQSSEQFFNFLRLMQLFPDVHPATLHTVLVLCKNQFFCAVDKLIYAKKCKEMYSNRNSGCLQNCSATMSMKTNRLKPYPCNRTNPCSNEKFQNFNDQSGSIDFSKPKLVCEKQFNPRKGEDCCINDLQPVVSPTCQLPIRPLSPIIAPIAQDFSKVTEESSSF